MQGRLARLVRVFLRAVAVILLKSRVLSIPTRRKKKCSFYEHGSIGQGPQASWRGLKVRE